LPQDTSTGAESRGVDSADRPSASADRASRSADRHQSLGVSNTPNLTAADEVAFAALAAGKWPPRSGVLSAALGVRNNGLRVYTDRYMFRHDKTRESSNSLPAEITSLRPTLCGRNYSARLPVFSLLAAGTARQCGYRFCGWSRGFMWTKAGSTIRLSVFPL
jgi:hypothetical protein